MPNILLILLITLLITIHTNPHRIPSLIKNQLSNSLIAVQYNANSPGEDTFTINYLPNNKGILMAVFDGHLGNKLAIYANERIYSYFNEDYKSNDEEQNIIKALSASLKRIEDEWYKEALRLYQNEKGIAATVGACALVAVLIHDRLYVANLGDSKGRLYSEKKTNNDSDNSSYDFVKLTKTFNASKKDEQERLIKEFPNDHDIILCRTEKACYVKGRLQPTRSLGDFHLKYKEFNEHKLSKSNMHIFQKEVEGITKPYISSVPDVKVFKLTSLERWIVFASDGLWDIFDAKEIGKFLKESDDKKETIDVTAEGIIVNLLTKVADGLHIKMETLMKIPPGDIRRKWHDDTTMILLSLNNNKKQKK